MKYLEPDYAPAFRCLAGSCPDTCCKDWEIIIDPQTLARYKALPGTFGEEVRAALTKDTEGETMFRLQDGHCPLLREDGLCRVQLVLGEEGLCNTCRAHPRFYEEYGQTRELTLSLSCPACAQLLLNHPEKITFLSREDGAPVSSCNDLDPAVYLSLRAARETALCIAQNRALPLAERLALLLFFAERAQRLFDSRRLQRLPALCARFEDEKKCSRLLARAKRLRARKGAFFPCWMVLNNMEHLGTSFPKKLDAALQSAPAAQFTPELASQWENLLVYFLWREFLKASTDERLLCRVQSCVFHVISLAALFSCEKEQSLASLTKLCSLYSKEVEHSEENLALLRRVFSRGTLTQKTLLRLL